MSATTTSAPETAFTGSRKRSTRPCSARARSTSSWSRIVASGRGDRERVAEFRCAVDEAGGDIVAIAHPGDAGALQREPGLFQRLQVGHDLAGMRLFGEAVDDRHTWRPSRTPRHRHGGWRGSSRHRHSARARAPCPPPISPRPSWVSPELSTSDDAAELADCHVEGDARACRVLLEDHRQRAPGERRVLVRCSARRSPLRAALRDLASSRIDRSSPEGSGQRSMKWRAIF